MTPPFTLAKPLVYSPRVLSPLSLLSSALMSKSHWILPLLLQHARTSWAHCTWEEYPVLLRESFAPQPSWTPKLSASLHNMESSCLFPLVPNSWVKSTPIAGSARRMLKQDRRINGDDSIPNQAGTTCCLHPQHPVTIPHYNSIPNSIHWQVHQALAWGGE